MTPSPLFRFTVALFDLGYRVSELKETRFGGVEETHDRMPADSAATALYLRDVGRVNVEAGGQLVLRQLRSFAQHLERLAEHSLVIGGVSQLSTFSQVGLSWRGPKHSAPAPLERPGAWHRRVLAFGASAKLPAAGSLTPSPSADLGASNHKEEPKMTSTVTIPAAGIADTREALLFLLGRPLEAMAHALTLPERELHPEWFEGDREHFEQVCRLLDVIGWDAAAPVRKVEVSGEDARTIREAVEDYLPMVEQWLCEAKQLRVRREHRDSVQAMWSLLAALPRVAGDESEAA